MEASRDSYFAQNRAATASYYLADPDNPFQQSGRGCGQERWDETRRVFADLVDRPGSYLDVGCANGLLLQSLAEWVTDHRLDLFGVDFVAGLVALASERLPDAVIWEANAWDWDPPQRFTHVRTNLEYVPEADWPELVRRHARWVEPGGRLVVAHYPDRFESPVDVVRVIAEAGLQAAGAVPVDRNRVAWWDSR
ncbi:MAG: class I SAM-dependent methyltransferase [Acidimicrobiia bacterium]|nr:class I SAM-dependent methyltransferase [Acidimicrobiia bacterium]